MGIQGLLPLLKSIMVPIAIEELRGQTVAVDTYSWLHKGALSCSMQLCKGLPTSKHIDYCMHRVNLLRHHGVKPILVFDGGFLPIKIDQETKRARVRKENLERALEHEATGNSSVAYECYQKAVDISPSIAWELIQVLKKERVNYIVAPYEADAQMTFLSINKLVDAVITEDSDLVPFGCHRIIFKMDKFGQGVEFKSSMLGKNKELDFTGFTKTMLLEMCIFSGCDYLQSLPGMGLKRAHALVQKFKSYEKVIKHLRYNSVAVPPHYEETFKKAMWAFKHQRVYDPAKKDIVHLSDIPHDLTLDLEFLGPWLSQSLVQGIAKGDIDPLTKAPFQENEASANVVSKNYTEKEFVPPIGRKRLDLPVQKNILTNYFCLASIEARRKFIAPKTRMQSSSASNDDHTNSVPDSAKEAVTKFIVPKTRPQSSSPSNNDHTNGLPDSAEEAAPCTATYSKSSMPSSGKLSYHSSDDLVDDWSSFKSNKLIDVSPQARCNSPELPCSLMETNIDPSEIDDACNPTVKTGTVTARPKIIVRTSNFKTRLIGKDDQNNQKKGHQADTEYACGVLNSCPLSKGAFSRNNNENGIIKKRKLQHVGDEIQGAHQSKNMSLSASLSEEGMPCNLTNEENTNEVQANFGCDISHLKNYSSIAEKSMERFASLMSSFKYNSSGSRASGLRAPLRDVQNTSSSRARICTANSIKHSFNKNKR
ncbi:exonuclease 1-like [Dioscorea cayenensis subsp. rotundata]|uniref:Exonuclease 1 n=1 Tax=Dioscorea cayennensis subsp. rotundata TaxID=55577 RepID=A0AB40BSU8_DIOCR|nr:exonuclease 1-like [Dioscorea cayenensis subsp. rotundata]